jgi:hypothetical protein
MALETVTSTPQQPVRYSSALFGGAWALAAILLLPIGIYLLARLTHPATASLTDEPLGAGIVALMTIVALVLLLSREGVEIDVRKRTLTMTKRLLWWRRVTVYHAERYRAVEVHGSLYRDTSSTLEGGEWWGYRYEIILQAKGPGPTTNDVYLHTWNGGLFANHRLCRKACRRGELIARALQLPLIRPRHVQGASDE